jgi:hypothetical protein
MFLSMSGETFVLRCRCNAVALSFCDSGVEITGTVKCGACGTEAEWGTLIDEASEDAGGAAEPQQSAEIHVLYP